MLEQDGHHFADDIFKCIFLKENLGVLMLTSQLLVPGGFIDNKSALV